MDNIIRKRAAERGVVSKKSSRIEAIFLEGNVTSSAEISAIKRQLNEKLLILQTLDRQIVDSICSNDEEDITESINSEIEVNSEYEELIFATLHKIESLESMEPKMGEIDERQVVSNTASEGDIRQPPKISITDSLNANSSEVEVKQVNVKLPKLQIRKFDGSVTEFQGWLDTFMSVVHNNSSLQVIDKFIYLKSLLGEKPANAIKGLPLSASNYEAALDILRKRFGNKQAIVSSHMESLLCLPHVRSNKDTRGLRQIFDQVENNLRSLQALGIESKSYGSLLVPIVLTRLPDEMRLIISRTYDSEEQVWQLDELLEAFSTEVKARERCELVSVEENLQASVATLNVNGENSKCIFCSDNHKTSQCRTVANPNARKSIIIKQRRCFLCLSNKHMIMQCKSKSFCGKCSKKHNTALHGARFQAGNNSERNRPQNAEKTKQVSEDCKESTEIGKREAVEEVAKDTLSCHVYTERDTLLQTAQAQICNTETSKYTQVRLIFDNASNRSYITEESCRKLGLVPIASEVLNISVFGKSEPETKRCDVVQFSVKGQNDNSRVFVTATVVPTICKNMQCHMDQEWFLQNYDCFKNLNLADPMSQQHLFTDEVSVLIGADYYWAFVGNKVVRSKNGPVAISTKLGYVLSGPIRSTGNENSTTLFVKTAGSNDFSEFHKFWELEDINDGEEETNLVREHAKNISFNGKRYSVSLPFKDFADNKLSDNYQQSKKRLNSLLSRLKMQPSVLKMYNNIIEQQIRDNIIEDVTNVAAKPGKAYYMPHHGVQRPDKLTTKLRIVYDASAKSHGKSLNDIVKQGPNLLKPIFDILVRFRKHKIALVADIEKAFFQIEINESDRDYLRFLWVCNPFGDKPEIREFRFNRVVFGVCCSPFQLNATIRYHVDKYTNDMETVTEILASLYVDDMTSGAQNTNLGFELYQNSKRIMAEGGFNLRKWESNCNVLMDRIRQEEISSEDQKPTNLDLVEDSSSYSDNFTHHATLANESESKVLGLVWDKSTDEFVYRFNDLQKRYEKKGSTKRDVLSVVSGIYDPLGLISPAIVTIKLLFQKICSGKGKWDDTIPNDLKIIWEDWLKNAVMVADIRFFRCYLPSQSTTFQLHTFFDASKDAYAAVLYLRSETVQGVNVYIVSSKSKVAPLKPGKPLTIPRLELLGGVLAARLWQKVYNIIVEPTTSIQSFFWGDSKVALCWINTENESKYKQFVNNRIVAIKQIAGKNSWSHVPGKENPADLPSRGVKPEELVNNSFWRSGPTWLKESRENWPELNSKFPDNSESLSEAKLSIRNQANTLEVSAKNSASLGNIIEDEMFSSFERLCRVTAYVLRFVHNLKNMSKPSVGELSVPEVKKSETLWIKTLQERMKLEKRFERQKLQLRVYEDSEGLLRCRGRIDNSEFPNEVSNPVILPGNQHITRLIIREAHNNVFHNGVNQTMSYVRSKFWIPSLRQITRSIVRKCVVCKRLEGKPYTRKEPPQLPDFRVRPSNPFAVCAIDFAGPVYVKMSNYRRAPSVKAYIALITCAFTRALHLELTPDLTATALIRCLRRFISRRSCPELFISDNAKTFGAEEVKQFLRDRRIEWHFNLPKAPWQNGIVERLVKSVKRCLKKRLGRARLSYEEMETVIIEVENTINNRPMTYIDNDDSQGAVSPNHLLHGKRQELVNTTLLDPEPVNEMSTDSISRRMVYRDHLVRHFIQRWKEEYLLALRDSHRENVRRGKNIQLGDVVLLADDGPRIFWRLATVIKLKQSKDQEIRGAVLRVADREQKYTQLERPIELIYPLEVSANAKLDTVPETWDLGVVGIGETEGIPDGETDSESN